MTTLNKESKEVTLYVRMCATLAFLRPEDVEAVSYTHLDVYKRQFQMLPF